MRGLWLLITSEGGSFLNDQAWMKGGSFRPELSEAQLRPEADPQTVLPTDFGGKRTSLNE